MDPRPAAGRLDDAGFASIQFVVAAALAMVVVVGLTQVVAYQYARGAAMTALERGVRAASVSGAGEIECRLALADSLADVLGGEVGRSLEVGCTADGETVRASARGVMPSWVPGVADWAFEVETMARREPIP